MQCLVKIGITCKTDGYGTALKACSGIGDALEESTSDLIIGELELSYRTVDITTTSGAYLSAVKVKAITGNRKDAVKMCDLCNSLMANYAQASVAIDIKDIPDPVKKVAEDEADEAECNKAESEE